MVEEDEQQVTASIKWNGITVLISSVYAKRDVVQKEGLWVSLKNIFDMYSFHGILLEISIQLLILVKKGG